MALCHNKGTELKPSVSRFLASSQQPHLTRPRKPLLEFLIYNRLCFKTAAAAANQCYSLFPAIELINDYVDWSAQALPCSQELPQIYKVLAQNSICNTLVRHVKVTFAGGQFLLYFEIGPRPESHRAPNLTTLLI